MKQFLDDDFLLNTATAQRLYHDHASKMPILDYHCHLSPADIAADTKFNNLTQAWLSGDHYKWRAMRANGVAEEYCTGNKSDWEKFEQWAHTVPYTLRNPLYHWTHLELQRYFGISDILSPATARKIYHQCNELLGTDEFSVRNLLRRMNVKLVGTTDDPADSLQFHAQLQKEGFEIAIVPSFRPDRAMDVANAAVFKSYVQKIEQVSDFAISTLDDYLVGLKKRHDFFGSMGCGASDHGLEEMYADQYTHRQVSAVFEKIISGKELDEEEQRKFKSAMLVHFAEWDWEKGWVQQFHLGAMRNNNTRMMKTLGPDTGWDSIGDFRQGRSLVRFLDGLDEKNKLAKTILYNLNPADNELFCTLAGNFNDGSVAGKMQWGSAWWFLDQKDGMSKQINTLSAMGLLSRFVGMITDSRSFLSYPRHEYFRRILCGLLGDDIENGELPNDISGTGKMIGDICFNNAKNYFTAFNLGNE